MNLKKYFLLNWKKTWIIVISWFILVMLHNLISALFSCEEAFFFILAGVIMPVYIIISIVYSLVYIVRKKNHNSKI